MHVYLSLLLFCHHEAADGHSLNYKERLIKPSSNWPERKEDDAAEDSQGRNTRRFLLGTENGKTILEVIADPETTVDSGGEKHETACHAMKKIEFFITVARSEK